MRQIAVIGVADGWSTRQLCAAFESLGCTVHLVEMEGLCLDLPSGTLRWCELDLGRMDAVVVKKIGNRYSPDLLFRLDLLQYLARVSGVPVFSPPEGMRLAVDRLSCTLTLRAAGIPMPETTLTEDPEAARLAVERYGEAVLKPLYTSKARGMRVVRAGEGLGGVLREYREEGNELYYIQRFVRHGGQDLGVVFLDGNLVGSYARVRGDSWNTTILHGGHYAAARPGPEVIELARRAQRPFGLSFTCVDVVETADGPLVYEVSAFGGFRGLLKATGQDVAPLYARWVLERLDAAPGGPA
jgi:tetrahydromethanopterin:alpha-L-glutamate ligase